MTGTEYSRLLSESACVSASEGNYLIQNLDVFPILGQLIPSMGYGRPARWQKGVSVLFSNPLLGSPKDITLLSTRLCFDGVDKWTAEYEAFSHMLRSGAFPPKNLAAELFDDHCINCDREIPYEKVTFVLFSSKEVKVDASGRRIVPLKFDENYFFWQSAVKVCCCGRQYYIYRRNYLTGDINIPYHRLDIAVYDEHGLIKDRAITEKVYAKYRLSCLF